MAPTCCAKCARKATSLPVICLTARDQQIDRIGGLRAGADDYIVKPFDVAELDARIRAVLRRCDRADAQLVLGALRLSSDQVRVLANESRCRSRRASCTCCAACSRTRDAW